MIYDSIGYAGYYAAMATFIWLSVISFDVWRRFGLHPNREFCRSIGNTFLYYNLIVWSSAGILTLVILVVDKLFPYSRDSNSNFVPAVGVTSCWILSKCISATLDLINPIMTSFLADGWSGMAYFYGPICIFILFNVTMFYLTIRNIHEEKKLRPKVSRNYADKAKSRNLARYYIISLFQT